MINRRIEIGYKYCPCCEGVLLEKKFYKDKSKKDGLCTSCIDCKTKKAKAEYQRRRARLELARIGKGLPGRLKPGPKMKEIVDTS